MVHINLHIYFVPFSFSFQIIKSMNNTNHFVITETKRKRLKVVSACNECRRKKTKCNGESPCASCIKSSVNCLYSIHSSSSILKKTAHNQSVVKEDNNVIQSIENRLNRIEDILHQLLLRQHQDIISETKDSYPSVFNKKRKRCDEEIPFILPPPIIHSVTRRPSAFFRIRPSNHIVAGSTSFY
ncbi:uncharacterized protein BX663DRAFT_520005 [Cokeromyces recurvatus]|uniref:uncharacterized protein n=1 Tax=Cokeromyces recurvatus TaxID=90255 RepID=UPI00222031CA|nr:uncharacterized protein BX663DRAFT_520005 [Cokeromyces recurvatus]KAI7899678.1 hypothetical protein BX663DRAFT_520005 [Cokeromyces recurvatus]